MHAEFEEYFVKYCQSRKTFFQLWIMLWCFIIATFHSSILPPHPQLGSEVTWLCWCEQLETKGQFTQGPKSKFMSLEINPCNLNHWERWSWDLPLHTSPQVLRLKHGMDVYMTTFFGGDTWNLCWELGWAKTRSHPQQKSHHI